MSENKKRGLAATLLSLAILLLVGPYVSTTVAQSITPPMGTTPFVCTVTGCELQGSATYLYLYNAFTNASICSRVFISVTAINIPFLMCG